MAPLLANTKHAMYAERIAQGAINSAWMDSRGLDFLLSHGLEGSPAECAELDARIKSAILSELESAYHTNNKEA